MIHEMMSGPQKMKEAARIVKEMIVQFKREYWELAPFVELLTPKEGVVIDGRSGKPMEFKTSSDGEFLYYSVSHIMKLDSSGNRKHSFFQELMHTLLHCILGDPEYYQNSRAKKLFSAYADLRVLYFMDTFYGMRGVTFAGYQSYRSWGRLPESFILVRHNKRLCGSLRKEAGELEMDEHVFWEKQKDKRIWDRWKELAGGGDGDREEAAQRRFQNLKDLSEQIKDSKRARTYGSQEGEIEEEIKAAVKNDSDYREVLREFIKNNEKEMEDPESIDNMIYTYGLDLYGDVALIEPAENSIPVDNGMLAIAIDTSGSCAGEIASRFLREVSNLLRDICKAGTTGELVLYQCDCSIAKKEKISDISEIETDIEAMSFYGFGGTAFEPVFEDIKKNEEQVRGLFYLSDGWGSYPDEKPDYPVFFIVPKCDYEQLGMSGIDVPDWIRFLPLEDR